jgi:hypothetical protein
MSFRKRAGELLEVIRSIDTDDGVSVIDLMKATGYRRALVIGSLVWLEDCSAISMSLDEGRKRWMALPEAEEVNSPDPGSAVLESLDYSETLASLGDPLAVPAGYTGPNRTRTQRFP